MKKKIVELMLVAALALTAIGGTFAYFTDTETKTNTFTVGSVDIQLLESNIYTNNTPVDDAQIRESAKNYDTYLAGAGELVVPGREFMKAIYVDNTGDNDAYVRVRVQVTRDQFNSFYFTENTTALTDGTMTKSVIAYGEDGYKKDYSTTWNESEGKTDFTAIKADDKWTMLEYIYTYNDSLAAKDLTAKSPVMKFQMKHTLDNEDVDVLRNEEVNTKIPVYADAIQAEGFDSAEEAFADFEKQETGDKVESPNVVDSSDTVFGNK